jgi:hypothetical protein
VDRESTVSFFPWTSVVRIDRGHAPQGRKAVGMFR